MKHFTGAVIAEPVDHFLRGALPKGVVRGSGLEHAYIDVNGWVIALTAQTVPPMPNGICVSQSSGLQAFAPGADVRVDRDRLVNAAATVEIRSAQSWNPSVYQPEVAGADFARLGRDIWQHLGLAHTDVPRRMVEILAAGGFDVCADGAGRAGLLALFQSIAGRDPGLAKQSVGALLGRGPGLTPEGDDFLAAAGATIHACTRSCRWSPEQLLEWRSSIVPADIRARTSSLSATLLELAASGHVGRPVQTLLDVDAHPDDRADALKRLENVGHGTGRAWAAGCAATAILATLATRSVRAP